MAQSAQPQPPHGCQVSHPAPLSVLDDNRREEDPVPSQARQALDARLSDLDDLELAHADADADAEHANNPGRRWNVHGLNRGGILLLSAHLEGYLEDLMEEALAAINPTLNGRPLRRGFTNPTARRIDEFYELLGLQDATKHPSIRWQNATNQTVRRKLGDLVALRNQIAHGQQTTVHLTRVTHFRGIVVRFAARFDEVIRQHLTNVLGAAPWPP